MYCILTVPFLSKLLFLPLHTMYVQTCRSDWMVDKLSWCLSLLLVHSDFIISPILEVASDTASYTWRVM